MAVGQFQAWLPRDPQIYIRGAIQYPEAANQTFVRYTPVILDANGRIAAAGVSPALLYGVVLNAGSNAAAGAVNNLVYEFRPGDVWQITQLEALVQNEFGVAAGDLGVVKDATTGFWYGSTADAGAQVRAIDFLQGPAGYNIGDTKATVFVVVHQTKIQVV